MLPPLLIAVLFTDLNLSQLNGIIEGIGISNFEVTLLTWDTLSPTPGKSTLSPSEPKHLQNLNPGWYSKGKRKCPGTWGLQPKCWLQPTAKPTAQPLSEEKSGLRPNIAIQGDTVSSPLCDGRIKGLPLSTWRAGAPKFSHCTQSLPADNRTVGQCFLNGFNHRWTAGKQMGPTWLMQSSIYVTGVLQGRGRLSGGTKLCPSPFSLLLLLDVWPFSGNLGPNVWPLPNKLGLHFRHIPLICKHQEKSLCGLQFQMQTAATMQTFAVGLLARLTL